MLAVPVQYLPPVAEVETSEELEEEELHVVRVEGSWVLLHVAAQVRLLGGREGGTPAKRGPSALAMKPSRLQQHRICGSPKLNIILWCISIALLRSKNCVSEPL